MHTTETIHDYVFEIAQEIRENGLKEWSEERKEAYWRETTRACEERGIEIEYITEISSIEFKSTVGNSHVFTHEVGIPFSEVDKHYGTMRAGAAHIIRKRNPNVFLNLTLKLETK